MKLYLGSKYLTINSRVIPSLKWGETRRITLHKKIVLQELLILDYNLNNPSITRILRRNCQGCLLERGRSARRIFFLGPCISENVKKKPTLMLMITDVQI
jgi:hypothetical protein